MKISHINDFYKGWFVGKFKPSLLEADFEVGLREFSAGEHVQDHFHKLSSEINLVIEGTLVINGVTFNTGDIFILYPYEVSQVEYITDVKLIIVRDHSNPTDKYEIEIKK